MCLGSQPSAKAPPPPAPPPVETARLAIKGSESKTKSKRTSKRTSGKSAFRSDLSLSTGDGGSGLNI